MYIIQVGHYMLIYLIRIQNSPENFITKTDFGGHNSGQTSFHLQIKLTSKKIHDNACKYREN